MQFLLLAQYIQSVIASNNKGYTIVELLVVIAIMGLVLGIVVKSFSSFKNNQALQRDTELIVEVLNQARNQTISSKNLSQYGVHFASSTVTVFSGTSYSSGASDNQNYSLNSSDTVLSLSLTGASVDIIFSRLSGEALQTGTVTVFSPGLSQTKTVTIYSTGVIESQ